MNVQRGVPRGAAPHGARALSRPARALVVRHVWPRFGRDQPAAAPSKSVAGPVPPANLTMVLTVIGTGLAVTMALSSALSTVKADLRADIDRQGVEITRQGSELKADLARQGSEIKADLARAENRWYTVSQKVAAVEAVVDLLTPPQQPK